MFLWFLGGSPHRGSSAFAALHAEESKLHGSTWTVFFLCLLFATTGILVCMSVCVRVSRPSLLSVCACVRVCGGQVCLKRLSVRRKSRTEPVARLHLFLFFCDLNSAHPSAAACVHVVVVVVAKRLLKLLVVGLRLRAPFFNHTHLASARKKSRPEMQWV